MRSRAIWDRYSSAGGNGPSPAGGISAGLDALIARYTGKHVSFFNNGSFQCVDLFNFYNKEVVHASFIPGTYAFQLWTTAPSSKYARVDRNAAPVKGDVAIYGPGLPFSQGAGHVGIVVKAIDANNIMLFEQNHYG